MQKPNSKKSVAKTAKQKAWHGWLKQQPCSFCGSHSGSIVDHCKGSTFINDKVRIGEEFCNSKCQICDDIVTLGARKNLFEKFGFTDSDATLQQMKQYEVETGITFSDDILNSIHDVYAVNEDVTDWMSIL